MTDFNRFFSVVVLSLVTVGLVLAPRGALAYTFVPTDSEWRTWPAYCKARYVSLPFASTTPYARAVSADEISRWRSELGGVFEHIHHYCAGLAYMQQYRILTDDTERNRRLEQAESEFAYTYERVAPENYYYGIVAARFGMLLNEQGETGKAIEMLQRAIEAQPQYDGTYMALSMVYKDAGRTTEQQDILLRGNDALDGRSAEIHYFLGMNYFNAGEMVKATEHAERAYSLGYPLPSLAIKLRREGVALNVN